MEVIVPDDQLSLAIGKKGQNVRLASRLTGWRLDVRGEAEAEEEARNARQSLMAIPGIGDVTAELLYQDGFKSAEELRARADVDRVGQVEGVSSDKAAGIVEVGAGARRAEAHRGRSARRSRTPRPPTAALGRLPRHSRGTPRAEGRRQGRATASGRGRLQTTT